MTGRPIRTVLSILMDILVVVAIVMTVALIVGFFGSLAAQAWGDALLAVAERLTIPFGVKSMTTPYGGVFSVDLGLTVCVVLIAEWFLGYARRQA